MRPAKKRELVRFLVAGFKTSERKACRTLGVSRSSMRYQSRADEQVALRLRFKDLAAVRVRWGYRRLHVLLGREGWKVNHIRDAKGFGARVPALQTGRAGTAAPQAQKEASCFAAGSLPAGNGSQRPLEPGLCLRPSGGRPRLSGPYVSRVSPAMEADFCLTGKRVTEVLDAATVLYGLPKALCVDIIGASRRNGPEFSGKDLDTWAYRRGVALCFSRPGKPTRSPKVASADNAFVESFNGRLREECLNAHWFHTLSEARCLLEAWRKDYNEQRPHSSLGLRTPAQSAAAWRPPELANTSL